MCKDKVNVWRRKSHYSKARTSTCTPNHRACQCKTSAASLPFQTSWGPCHSLTVRTEPPLHSPSQQPEKKRSTGTPCGQTVTRHINSCTGRFHSPKVISIQIPSKLQFEYILQHHAMHLENSDFRKDEENILLYFKVGYQLMNFSLFLI